MGMTDKQFNAYLRLIINDLNNIKDLVNNPEKYKDVEKEIEKLISILTETMKD